jgi:hypothetical protein
MGVCVVALLTTRTLTLLPCPVSLVAVVALGVIGVQPVSFFRTPVVKGEICQCLHDEMSALPTLLFYLADSGIIANIQQKM